MDNADDLTARLSELLNDPDGMNRIKAMADSVLGGNGKSGGGETGNSFDGLSSGELDTIMKLGRLLMSDSDDSRSQLLLALKPHLSVQRRERVDRAVKLLRIASILPLISEQGLL